MEERTNRKLQGNVKKASFVATPPSAILALAQAMQEGHEKYGLMDYRGSGVDASTYYDAAMRHLLAWIDGEDVDPHSGVHPLGHVMACCAILIDTDTLGVLRDDRPKTSRFRGLLNNAQKQD